MNRHIGKNIGELCKTNNYKKLSVQDYILIAKLREDIRNNKELIFSKIKSEALKDAIRLMPTFMSAYLLYISGDYLFLFNN